jgi:hypothetical protein
MYVKLAYLREVLLMKVQVDELWDSMCQSAINLITSQLHTVENDELLLKIKGRIALFMLTMEVRRSVIIPPGSLLTLP